MPRPRPSLHALGAGALVLIIAATATAIPGAPDTSFGPNGQRAQNNILVGLGEEGTQLTGLTILRDGAMLVTSTSRCAMSCVSLVMSRYTSAGGIDRSYGVEGVTGQPGVDEYGPQSQGLLVTPDGATVLGYLSRGGPIPQYGMEGAATLLRVDALGRASAPLSTGLAIRPLALLPGGRVLGSAGRTLVRLRPDGSVDTSFGRGGTVLLPGSVPMGFAADVRAGTIRLGGLGRTRMMLVRLTATGRQQGVTQVGVPGTLAALDRPMMVARPGGGVFLGGVYSSPGGGPRLVVAAFRADGRRDLRFGRRGISTQPLGVTAQAAIAVDARGRLLTLTNTTPASASGVALTLRRELAVGGRDRTFPAPRVRLPGFAVGMALAVDASGRPVAAIGHAPKFGQGGVRFIRFRS